MGAFAAVAALWATLPGPAPSSSVPVAAPALRAVPVAAPSRPAAPPAPRRAPENLVRDGLIAARTGQLPEAARLLSRATELEPGNADAWSNLGVVLIRQGETTRGVEAFRRALRARPGHPDAHLNLAVALDRQGREREAARHYRAFLAAGGESDPRRREVGERLERLGPARGRGE